MSTTVLSSNIIDWLIKQAICQLNGKLIDINTKPFQFMHYILEKEMCKLQCFLKCVLLAKRAIGHWGWQICFYFQIMFWLKILQNVPRKNQKPYINTLAKDICLLSVKPLCDQKNKIPTFYSSFNQSQHSLITKMEVAKRIKYLL